MEGLNMYVSFKARLTLHPLYYTNDGTYGTIYNMCTTTTTWHAYGNTGEKGTNIIYIIFTTLKNCRSRQKKGFMKRIKELHGAEDIRISKQRIYSIHLSKLLTQ